MIKKIFLLVTIISCFYTEQLYAQQGKVDSTFNTLDDGQNGDGFDNTVRTLSLQSDQNLIVGGDYLNLNGIPASYLTRLKPEGIIDETFNTGTGFNGKIYTSYIQSDGKIIVGGSFTTYNGVSSGRLIRLNSDGSQDTTFNTTVGATTGIIYKISPQTDGKIIIVGSFTKYNNVTVNRIARVLPDGGLDVSFLTGSGSLSNITNVEVLSDGRIVLVGNFVSFKGVSVNRIVCLFSDGSIDNNFNIGIGFNDDVNAMAVQSDGKIILGGKFTDYNGNNANRIIRIHPNGTLDNSFFSGSGFSADAVQTIKIDPFGNIMIAGSFTGFYNGTAVNRICLLNPEGTLNADFDIGSGAASASVLALENDTEGVWYVGGSFSVFDGLNQGKLAKINPDGDHDIGYLSAGVGFDSSVFKVVPLSNKKTMVFGNFTKFNGSFASRVARVLENGLFDASFNSGQLGANNLIKSAVLQVDGKIIFGGNFTKYNETVSNRVVRILPDGVVDNTFNIGLGFNGQVYAIALQSDEKVIVAGSFTSYNGVSAGRIIRLLQNGSRDTTFNTGLGADTIIEAVLVQADGKILVAGRFNTFDDRLFSRLVRLNSNGSIDSSFNVGVGFDKFVFAMALQSDNKIVLGGSFLTYNGISQKRIVRLNSNGSLDTTFESGTGFNKGDVRSILIQPDDRILVGGTFSGTYRSDNSLRLIRLEKSGNYDASFEAQLNNKLYTMSFTYDHKLIIGGDFNSISGISKHRVTRLKLCLDSTVWNGTTWSNGFASEEKEVFFKGDYEALNTTNVCSCFIEKGKKVTLLSGNTLGIEFSYHGSGVLTLEDSASIYQSDDDIVNSGIVHLKRKSTPILQSDYTYWSSPVQNQKLIEVSPKSELDKFFIFNSGLNNWAKENPSNDMIPGKGYILRGPLDFSSIVPEKFEAVFRGIPNNGKINANFETTSGSNLIGNPYPSALSADAFLIKNKQKTLGALYFWTHNTPIKNKKYTANDYAVYNLLGGVGTRKSLTSGINETIPDGTIATGQAFFIGNKERGIVEFNNSMRIIGRNSAFFKSVKKSMETDSKSGIEKHRIWINFSNSDGIFKQILLGYVEGATNLYDDQYDAATLKGNQLVDFYSIVENKNLVIQGRALPFVKTDSIVLGYKTDIKDSFSIDIDHEDGFFKEVNIFIEDKELKMIHDLKEQPYQFTTQEGVFDGRFVLRYTNKTLDKTNFENPESEIFVVIKDKIIKVSSEKEPIKEVSVFDVLGKLIYHKKNIVSREYVISTLFSQNQVLIVKIIQENGCMTTKKIIF